MKLTNIVSPSDKLNLSVAIAEPKGKPKAVVQISHGMAEHKERYFDFMNFLAENGYVVVIHDHRGHGESVKDSRDLGNFYTENINFIVDDLHEVTKFACSKYPNLDVLLFSHSMGTLVARNYLKKYDNEIKKVVLCGPPTKNSMAGLGVAIAKCLKPFHGKNKPNKILNKMTFNSYNKGLSLENEWICSNPETVKNYNSDNLCGFIFSTNGFINLFRLMKGAFNKKDWNVTNENLPIFVITGENDPVIQNEKKFNELCAFLKELGYKKVESKLYSGMRHELLNETDNAKVYSDVLNFFNK